MTNKEAIGILESISAKTDHFLISDDARSDAIDMAISALEAQTNCTEKPNDSFDIPKQMSGASYEAQEQNCDVILRKDAITALSHMMDIDGFRDGWAVSRSNVESMLKSLPSAQPEHLHTVMEKISKYYEKAMNTPCVNRPMALALYQTWKEYNK